jgi:hypothetical protein
MAVFRSLLSFSISWLVRRLDNCGSRRFSTRVISFIENLRKINKPTNNWHGEKKKERNRKKQDTIVVVLLLSYVRTSTKVVRIFYYSCRTTMKSSLHGKQMSTLSIIDDTVRMHLSNVFLVNVNNTRQYGDCLTSLSIIVNLDWSRSTTTSQRRHNVSEWDIQFSLSSC